MLIISLPYAYVEFSSSTHEARIPDTDINFVNYSDMDLDQYIWDFGDGNNVIQSGFVGQVDHYFSEAGTYIVSLTAFSGDKCASTQFDTIEILAPCPASYTEPSLIARGCEDLAVEFRANVLFADSFEWKFYGDSMYPESISNDETAYHTYREAGEFYPVLRAWVSGCDETYIRHNTVIVYTKPEVDFDVIPTANQSV